MMYLGHFMLREAPFSITPDTDYFYAHEGAQATLNMLLVALRSGEGFLKIVGELGCGKTLLCRQLLKTLQGECVTAYIPNPDMGPDDLLMALVEELGIVLQGPPHRSQVMKAINTCLLDHALHNRRVVLCVDEAQAAPLRTLERLRLLSNLETEKRKLLQIVLFGQPDLDTQLAQPQIRQLLQRIGFSEYLGALHAERVPTYLNHRLRTAAINTSVNTDIFPPEVAQAIAQASGCVPRVINVLAHKCLMVAYGENSPHITPAHLRLAIRDTPSLNRKRSWSQPLQRYLQTYQNRVHSALLAMQGKSA
jgi:MSHA biogenesis protein MshM